MRKFLYKILLYFILLGILAGLFLVVIFFRPELVDNFYYRFTTEKASSLILGTSRSAQGIMPAIINKRIPSLNNDIINHSFAIGPSSFGPNYLKEVKQKLKENTEKGIFIISVDPWSLATGAGNVNDDVSKFFEIEQELFVGNLSSSSTNPNFEYLFKYWNNRFSVFGNGFKHLINYKGLLELHEDGWLEVDIVLDSVQLDNRIKTSTEEYREKDMMLSDNRFAYLAKIVKFLQKRGQVFIVRMPVSVGMFELEENKFPAFDDRIEVLLDSIGVPYFNFIKDSGKYKTIDTHHLYKVESELFTHVLCDSVITSLANSFKPE